MASATSTSAATATGTAASDKSKTVTSSSSSSSSSGSKAVSSNNKPKQNKQNAFERARLQREKNVDPLIGLGPHFYALTNYDIVRILSYLDGHSL